jgi:hypothetical protein
MPRSNHQSDMAAMSLMTMATTARSIEEIRKAQLNAVSVCQQLWPGDEEGLIEVLKTLGLYGRTGLETTPAD